MRPSAEYVLVKNGKITGRPQILPESYGKHTNLRDKTTDELIEIGWYPVKYTCSRCNSNFKYIFNAEKNAVIATSSFLSLEEGKKSRKNQIWSRTLETLISSGFESSVLGEVHKYGFDFSLSIACLSAVVGGVSLQVPCINVQTTEFRSVEHGPEQLRGLLRDYAKFAASVYADAGDFIQDVAEAVDVTEVAAIELPSHVLAFASPFEPLGETK